MVNKKYIFLIFLFSIFSNPLEAKSVKAASINLCADHFLYMIADKTQITSLSYMARDKNISYISKNISNIKINNGRAEQIILEQPDVVFVGPGSSSVTIKLLQKLNYNVVFIKEAQNFSQIKSQVLLVSKILDQEDRGYEIIDTMNFQVKKYLEAKIKSNESIVMLGPNGFVRGEDSFVGYIFNLLGYRNITKKINTNGYNRLSLEELLLLNPKKIILENNYNKSRSLSQNYLQHKVVMYLIKKGDSINLSSNLISCSSPFSTHFIKELIMKNEK